MRKYLNWVTLALIMMAGLVLAEEAFTPKEATLPEDIKGVLDFFLESKTIQLGAMAGVVISIVTLIKSSLLLFGGKLQGKWAFIVTAGVSLLTTIGYVIQDANIAGTDWSVLAEGFVIFVGATLGYRVTLSTVAKTEGPLTALKTVFTK